MFNYELSDYQRTWLQTLYDFIKQGKNPNYRALRATLYKQLPEDFDPSLIDIALTGHYKGEDITLLGVHLLDPDRRILEKTNKVLLCIRKILLNDIVRKEVTAEEISDITSLSVQDVSLILKLASRYMRLYDSASGVPDAFGHKSINVDNDETFDAYLAFKSIEDLIEQYLSREQKSKHKQSIRQRVVKKDPIEKQNPIFRSRIAQMDLRMCFVLMPFMQDWSRRVYNELIRNTIEPMGVQCLRADNLTGPIIMEDIWVKINQSAFVIADVTAKNPNVMYEMGIVHTLGKPCILLTQEIDNIPFDFSHLRHHHYQDNVESFREMGLTLKGLVKDIYKTNYEGVTFNFT